MKQNSVGRYIHMLRTRNNISQQRLSKGLCSDATLSRIELGERIPDKFLADALYQRLGKSPDKFEVFLAEKDYILYEQRKAIEKALFRGDFPLAEELLEKYRKRKECKGNLHRQFLCKVQGILYYEDKRDIGHSAECFKEALSCTLPDMVFPRLNNELLSLEEMDIFLLLLMVQSQEVREYDNISALSELLNYIDSWYSDEEEKVKIYPKAAYLLAGLHYRKGDSKKAEELCEKAFNLLALNGVLAGLKEILSFYEILLVQNKKNEQADKISRYRKTLNETCREYGMDGPELETAIFARNTQSEIFLMGELLKSSRTGGKLSQENLSSDICTPESLSRIESGKRAPRNRNYEAFADRLGVSKEVYNSFIDAETYDVLQRKRDIDRMLSRNQVEDAWANFMVVKKVLTEKTDENRQYLIYTETLLLHQARKITPNGALKKLNTALACTKKDYKTMNIPDCILTRQEALIFNQMAILLNDTGKKDMAVRILRDVARSYENSKIDVKYHSVQYLLILQNLSMYLEEGDCFEEAIKICDKAIILALDCGRGNFIGRFLTNKAYTLERKDEAEGSTANEKTCQSYYRQAFSWSDLMKDLSTHSIVGEYYKLKYDEPVYPC